MKGFVRVAAAVPDTVLGDVRKNVESITALINEADGRNVKLLVLPELCITGYSLGDLFWQQDLLYAAKEGLRELVNESRGRDMLIFAGLPYEFKGRLYDMTAVLMDGRLLGLVPRSALSVQGDMMERQFSDGEFFMGNTEDGVPVGTGLIFECSDVPGFAVACENFAEAEMPLSMGDILSLQGASVLVSPSAPSETYGSSSKRADFAASRSRRLCCGYVMAGAGEDESTTDHVFGGQRLIAEAGELLCDSGAFTRGLTVSDIDIMRIRAERMKNARMADRLRSLAGGCPGKQPLCISFSFSGSLWSEDLRDRSISPEPFLSGVEDKASMSREILDIQAHALKKRFEHTHSQKAVIGLSGGLDSTLALLAARHAFRLMRRPMEDILCVTMPCFGTTDRTYDNACRLAREIGAELREIRISDSVMKHFEDIDHDPGIRNSAYENAQARERTQILMDIANDVGGLDIGTGDLSEEALGWCTFGGDHMANYAVNTSIPKTLIRVIVSEVAAAEDNVAVAEVLRDILDTPVSPELLPSDEEGNIKQKTEDIVGPYELHDFFTWYVVKYGFTARHIYDLALCAFEGRYEAAEIKKWLEVFYRRFFSQQFKRSTALDGGAVSEIDLSPRGSLLMPSDASSALWLSELSEL